MHPEAASEERGRCGGPWTVDEERRRQTRGKAAACWWPIERKSMLAIIKRERESRKPDLSFTPAAEVR